MNKREIIPQTYVPKPHNMPWHEFKTPEPIEPRLLKYYWLTCVKRALRLHGRCKTPITRPQLNRGKSKRHRFNTNKAWFAAIWSMHIRYSLTQAVIADFLCVRQNSIYNAVMRYEDAITDTDEQYLLAK